MPSRPAIPGKWRRPLSDGECQPPRTVEEPAEPKATLPPLLSPEEECSLARSVLDPWLEQLQKTVAPQQRIFGFRSLIRLNGLEAFRRLDWLGDVDKTPRDFARDDALRSIIAHREGISWEDVRAMIDASDDDLSMAADLIFGAAAMDAGEKQPASNGSRRPAAHARKVVDPSRRAGLLAGAAEQLFRLGEDRLAR